MASVTWLSTGNGKDPYWATMPPKVPEYVNKHNLLRNTPANKYTPAMGSIPGTYTSPTGSYGHQTWYDKWHAERPVWKTDTLKHGPQTHSNWKWEGEPGSHKKDTSLQKPSYKTWWETPDLLQDYWRLGKPQSETTRARGQYNIHWAETDPKLYPFSNNMTSTYRAPVWSKYGPMLRREVYGVNSQHNRHGNMPFDDYY